MTQPLDPRAAHLAQSVACPASIADFMAAPKCACGAAIANRYKSRCRACYLASVRNPAPPRHCSDCGKLLSRGSTGRCRVCVLVLARADPEVEARRSASLKKSGAGGHNRKPVPPDFAEHAAVEFSEALRARYGVAGSVIQRWRKETGVAPPRQVGKGPERVPMPADFASVAPTLNLLRLAAHYGRSCSTIRRWLQEAGVEAKVHDPKATARAAIVRVRPARITGADTLRAKQNSAAVKSHMRNTVVAPPRLVTLEERAADHLRRQSSVYRCTERGGFDLKGTFWRIGSAVLTGEELLARARAKGWDPDEWVRVA